MAAGSRFYQRNRAAPVDREQWRASVTTNRTTAMPMRHRVETENGSLRNGGVGGYAWRHEGRWNALQATAIGEPRLPGENSEEEFITEHYWGYTAQRNGGCAEYQVEHPRWNVWQACDPALKCDVASLYTGQNSRGRWAPLPTRRSLRKARRSLSSACGASAALYFTAKRWADQRSYTSTASFMGRVPGAGNSFPSWRKCSTSSRTSTHNW